MGLTKNDCLGTMHTSDHRRSKISGGARSFTEEKEEEEYDDENSDFAYERFLVWRDEGS